MKGNKKEINTWVDLKYTYTNDEYQDFHWILPEFAFILAYVECAYLFFCVLNTNKQKKTWIEKKIIIATQHTNPFSIEFWFILCTFYWMCMCFL